MPTFDFQCTSCEHVFEYSRPFGSTDTPECPECDHKDTIKLITPPTIHFKGDGFYKTDSTSKPVEKKAEPSEEKKTEKKTDEKKVDTSTKKDAKDAKDARGRS